MDASSGTIASQSIENAGGSSQRRSPERVCYDKLLRFGAHDSDLKSGNTVSNGPRGCYGFNPGLLPKGMFLRGGRFYLRRHIPCDVQAIVGRAEVWRSLKTDSLQTALRRLPIVAAEVEFEFERIRLNAGASFDQTLLGPCVDDCPGNSPSVEQTISTAGQSAAASLTLGTAYERYIDEAGPSRCARWDW